MNQPQNPPPPPPPQVSIAEALKVADEHLVAGRLLEAQELYRRVLSADANRAQALFGMGMVSAGMGRLDMAIQWLDRAVTASPQTPEYYTNLGEALRRSGLLTPAIGALQKALELRPQFPAARRLMDAAIAEKRMLDSAALPSPMAGGKYVIVTGYFNPGGTETEEFFKTWHDNTMRFAKPQRIFVINAASRPVDYGECSWINFSENLFHHMGGMPNGQQLGGFAASLLIGAMLAYHERCDLLYKEQDCLAFGGYVDRLYKDMGDKGMVSGPMVERAGGPPLISVSLILIRHEYLLEFVTRYISLWPSDQEYLPEQKLMEIAKMGRVAESKMGYDRNRPINYDDAAFHLQKITAEEMKTLREKGLI